ncbi:sulfur-oxidizing protein SoxZ [Enhydrobacter aerosaccus]|uniref:Sulfur-oxidizing protein SoxZ n=1 Tax=Enhydrobacter aerosaccus TaxID=225324 RepID=A0A1T4R5U8_9HYPH|nr:thiosulfate oxidation carrier complex protein SoxZ [Enhydrobacter aerosaccus]SKA11283.1 sulfur-oxidizing protein SoxZ [Enhydrobacter aerosaccus]
MANVLINAPKTARKGETIEVKALILHPMETGFRPGTNGTMIPRNIIQDFIATWNGIEIFRMRMSPAIAANPYVSFFTVASESGTIRFRWSGDNDFSAEGSVTVAVT